MYDTLPSAIFSAWADGTDLHRVQALLDEGHDVDGHDAEGTTPLIAAAMTAPFPERSELATRLLLRAGADPNRFDARGDRAPLHWAVCGIARGTVQALLEAGADPDLPCGQQAAPLHHALHELRRAWRDGRASRPDSAAATASAFVTDHIRALAEHGADLDRCSPGGRAPLAIAASIPRCPDAVIAALLDGGARPTGVQVRCEGVDVDLLAACLFSDLSPAVALRFVEAGVGWDTPYAPFGARPFVEVVPQYRPDIAFHLATHHPGFGAALVACRSAKGISMLGAAAMTNHEPLMRWLIEQGLRADERGDDGRTPIDVAREKRPEAVAFLMRSLQDDEVP